MWVLLRWFKLFFPRREFYKWLAIRITGMSRPLVEFIGSWLIGKWTLGAGQWSDDNDSNYRNIRALFVSDSQALGIATHPSPLKRFWERALATIAAVYAVNIDQSCILHVLVDLWRREIPTGRPSKANRRRISLSRIKKTTPRKVWLTTSCGSRLIQESHSQISLARGGSCCREEYFWIASSSPTTYPTVVSILHVQVGEHIEKSPNFHESSTFGAKASYMAWTRTRSLSTLNFREAQDFISSLNASTDSRVGRCSLGGIRLTQMCKRWV